MTVSRFEDFLKNLILGTELASFSDKKTKHILVVCPEMTLTQFPKQYLENGLDFLSKNDASSNPRNWIFCPDFTDRG